MPTLTTIRRRTATCSRTHPKAWGVWRIPEHELGVLGDTAGLDVLEYGCGAAQWSIALAQDGARAVGLDQSRAQLRHAEVLNRAHGTDVTLVCASGEAVPFRRPLVRRRVLRPRRDVVLRSVPRRTRGRATPPTRRSPRVRTLHAVGLHHLEPQARLHQPPAPERVLRDAPRRLRRGHRRFPSSVRRVDPAVPRARTSRSRTSWSCRLRSAPRTPTDGIVGGRVDGPPSRSGSCPSNRTVTAPSVSSACRASGGSGRRGIS